MDKKQTIIVSVISAIIVILVVAVVLVSDNTERLTKNQVLKVEDTVYTLDELNKFMYISKEEDGDIAKELSEEEKGTIYSEFIQTKVYVAAADSKKIVFPEDQVASAKSEYASKAETFANYGVTEEDFVKYESDNYKVRTLTSDLSAYYDVPKDIYDELKATYSGDDLKSYSFRTMRFYYEEPESGDASGDVAEIATESGDTEDKSKEAVLAKAEAARLAVLNGEDFETVAKEEADGMYSIDTNGSLIYSNGNLEHAVGPLLETMLNSKALYEKIKTLESGAMTDVIVDEESKTILFTKLESVEDDFVGEADKEYRRQLLYVEEIQATLISRVVDYKENTSSVVKFLYK